MNQLSLLDRKVQLVVLSDVHPHTQGDVICTSQEVFEVQTDLEDLLLSVDLMFIDNAVPIDVESDTCCILRKAADTIQFLQQYCTVKTALGGEIKVVGEAGAGEVALAKGVATLEYENISKIRGAIKTRNQPAEHVVTLDVRLAEIVRLSLAPKFCFTNHDGDARLSHADRRLSASEESQSRRTYVPPTLGDCRGHQTPPS